MRLLLIFLLLACVPGCHMPSPAFRGAAATRVSVAGATFDVRQRGLRAEAMRINPQYAPRFGPIRDKAALAMAQVTGCKVVRVTGDQALAFGALDCGTGPPPPVREPLSIECVPIRGSEIKGFDGVWIDLDCSPA